MVTNPRAHELCGLGWPCRPGFPAAAATHCVRTTLVYVHRCVQPSHAASVTDDIRNKPSKNPAAKLSQVSSRARSWDTDMSRDATNSETPRPHPTHSCRLQPPPLPSSLSHPQPHLRSCSATGCSLTGSTVRRRHATTHGIPNLHPGRGPRCVHPGLPSENVCMLTPKKGNFFLCARA